MAVFPTTSQLDRFRRLDAANLGANYTIISGYDGLPVRSYRCAVNDTGSGFEVWDRKRYKPNQQVWIVVAEEIVDMDTVWLVFRCNAAQATDGYRCVFAVNAGTLTATLYRISTNVPIGTSISLGVASFSLGDLVGIDATGGRYMLYYWPVGGVVAAMGYWEDANILTAGYIGLGASAWPKKIYVGTRAGGVFYTDTFTDPTDPTQPIWIDVSAGLASLIVRDIEVDVFNPVNRQVCLTCAADHPQDCNSAVAHLRYGAGNWLPILTEAQARVLTADANTVLDWVTTDHSVSGRIWVAGRTSGATIVNGPFYYFYSDDDGATWNYYSSITSITYYGGNLIANGNTLWHGRCTAAGSRSRVALSTDGGATWTQSTTGFTSGSFIPYVILNPLEPGRAYTQGHGLISGGLGLVDIAYVTTGNLDQTVLQDANDLGIQSPQWIWFSQNDADFQRVITNNTIYTTLDRWTTLEAVPAAKALNVDVMLAPLISQEDWLILGTYTLLFGQDHLIYTTIGDDGALSGKAGNDPLGGVNSIPRAASRIALQGIAIVK
jgi:hypothetical protein